MPTPPKVGARFLHRRVLGADNKPALYIVTAIRRGVVYYKQPDETKARECVPLGEWPKVCAELLP